MGLVAVKEGAVAGQGCAAGMMQILRPPYLLDTLPAAGAKQLLGEPRNQGRLKR